MKKIIVSTYTDPNGTKRTTVLDGGTPIFVEDEHGGPALRSAWNHGTSLFRMSTSARLVRWDGDAKLEHTVATK